MSERRPLRKAGLILAVLLFFFNIPIISYASGMEQTAAQETVWEEAASFAELTEKLDSMRQTGGNLRLTADITVEQGEAYDFIAPQLMGKEPVLLDFGPYTITVRGTLALYPYLHITGQGGQDGLFHVEEGGWLEVWSITVSAQDGVAIRQEERSILAYGDLFDGMPDFACEGEIILAGPVAVPKAADDRKYIQVLYVRDGERLEDILPETDPAAFYENGMVDYERDLPVLWDTEAFAGQIARKERFLLTGTYKDAADFSPPQCLVTFENGNPATLLSCSTSAMQGGLIGDVWVAFPRPGPECRLGWSSDGEHWQPCVFEIQREQDGRIQYAIELPGASYPFYLSAAVQSETGEERYSDTIRIDGPDDMGKIGGNRGGGTDILGSDLPPVVSPSEPEDGSALAPEASSGQNDSGMPDAEPDKMAPADAKAPASAREQNASAEYEAQPTPSQPVQEASHDENAGQESGAAEAPAEAPSAQNIQKKPEHTAPALQIIIGAAAIAGIAALVFTWGTKAGLGAKLKRFFRKKQ